VQATAGGSPAGPDEMTPALDGMTRASSVYRNRPFLLLWLAQAVTQVGGNMVIYGLTVVIFTSTRSSAAVSGRDA
jgi:hypothetical protein